MTRILALLILCACVRPPVAAAHDLAATLGVIDVDAVDPPVCEGLDSADVPRIIRTSIGPVYRIGNGGWGFGCPALHGDGATGPIVQLTDGTLVSVSSSRVWRSTDDGCAWHEVPLPGDRWLAYDLVAAEDSALVLARDTTEAGVYVVGSTGGLVLGFTSPRDVEVTADAMTPDGAAVAAPGLVVAGARPVADVRVVGPEATWSLGVPATPGELQRLSVRGMVGGDLYVIATTDDGRQLARLEGLRGDDAWSLSGPVSRSIHGPVAAGGEVWAVFDGVLHRRDGSGWVEVLGGEYTCIAADRDTIWLCDLYELLALRVTGGQIRDSGPVSVFSFVQLDARPDRCAWDDDVAQQCANEWVHYGAENGFVARDPALCPDGASALSVAADPGPDGCVAAGTQRSADGAPVWMLALAVAGVAWRRR